jgi:hypothetical protein
MVLLRLLLLLLLQLELLLLPGSWLLHELVLVAHLVDGLHVHIPLLLALHRCLQGWGPGGRGGVLLLLQARCIEARVVIVNRLEAVCAPERQAIGHQRGSMSLQLMLLFQVGQICSNKLIHGQEIHTHLSRLID